MTFRVQSKAAAVPPSEAWSVPYMDQAMEHVPQSPAAGKDPMTSSENLQGTNQERKCSLQIE